MAEGLCVRAHLIFLVNATSSRQIDAYLKFFGNACSKIKCTYEIAILFITPFPSKIIFH